MEKRRKWFAALVMLSLIICGGYVVYNHYFNSAPVAQSKSQTQEPTGQALKTAEVIRGDLSITADGSGELVPAKELDLAFRTSGVLDELSVEVGDYVVEGDVLARLETDKLERAVSKASVELELARLELADVRAGPSEAELADARAALRDAQVELQLAQAAYEKTLDSNLDAIVTARKTEYDWWVGYYQSQKAKYEAGHLSQADHDWAMAAMMDAEGRWHEAINQAEAEETQALSRITQAQNAVYQAQEALELLESEPLTDTLIRAELEVDRASMTYEKAVADLEAAQLYAPFDGVVMDVMVEVGDQIGANSAVITLATLQEPLLSFWVEESDMESVAVGSQVNVIFEAFPDDTFTGEIVRVAPTLVIVDGTSALQAWARLDLDDRKVSLFSGMTAEVEVVAAEAKGAILVPVEALRETSAGNYTVFVVSPTGEVEARPVVIGLQDAIYAEVLSGLEVGESVSLGEAQ